MTTKRFLLTGAGIVGAFALMGYCSVRAQTITVERTPSESDTLLILLGRACRASTDQDWIQVCGAAIVQAQKELEARKPKPVKPPDG